MNRIAPSMAVLVTGLARRSAPVAPATRAPRRLVRRLIRATSTSATSATSSAPPGPATTTSAGAYPTADVCTYLAAQVPALTAIGSPVGVQANLAGNLFGFFQSHGVPADGAQLDDATKAQCPDVRSQILVLSGLTSFTQL